MRRFENHVQKIKYEVLREISRLVLEGTLKEKKHLIPEVIDKGPEPRTRCCIHKERAITVERVNLAIGDNYTSNNVIQVLDEACDECPIDRFVVTEACRGCLAHRCTDVCPVGAITFINHRAYINQHKCIECGKCKNVCPYNAISDVMRPCRRACRADALSINEKKKAVIDDEKCIQCGACVYQCPFGAIMDKSYIIDALELLKESRLDSNLNVYAIIAPAISSQFTYVKIEQVITGIKKLGFHDVVEVALGADMVALHETKEYAESIEEKNVITSSCCPAFVSYIQKNYPEIKDKISSTVSPMIAISKLIKKIDPKGKVVFIGPCTAKKMEIKQENFSESTDYVITFEELAAMIDAADIRLEECEEGLLNNASFFGRIFARSGGLSEAINHIIEEENLEVDFRPIRCDGLDECDKALKMTKVNRLNGNFIEGMACKGGCIGGAASLTHGPKDKNEVDKYGKLALESKVKDSLRIFDVDDIEFHRKFS
ncbi:4Fe-4S dicluster domain-containing protein [Clostridium sp. D2Q-11]|uniref:4Fe-4S dicluster domain-containing protein n=1 Tax=Anaeromonas frigoriresistens TaxID=2683708 RepID=A0A942USF6_9FIRM|nr:4Fe-4S dicluster domain-containing protein [Anaeromonas frigoriresistens]MBS4537748.1 4Fe-4S dicluster domain-containing protein [Anaeromonas frigoriresistens]